MENYTLVKQDALINLLNNIKDLDTPQAQEILAQWDIDRDGKFDVNGLVRVSEK